MCHPASRPGMGGMPQALSPCTLGQHGSRSLRTVPHRESQVQGPEARGHRRWPGTAQKRSDPRGSVRTPPISITLSKEENSHFVIIKCIMHILKKCRIKAEMLSHKSKLLNPGHGPMGWGDSPVPNKTPSSPTPQATWASMTRDATSTDL